MHLRLQKNEEFALRGDCRGVRIRCADGVLWLTQAGDPADHFLLPQEEFVIRHAGTVIVEARRDAALSVTRGAPGRR